MKNTDRLNKEKSAKTDPDYLRRIVANRRWLHCVRNRNEEGNSDYLSHTIPILTAMRARLQKISPAAYKSVRFAFAYNNWDSPMGDALASAAYNVTDGAACMTCARPKFC